MIAFNGMIVFNGTRLFLMRIQDDCPPVVLQFAMVAMASVDDLSMKKTMFQITRGYMWNQITNAAARIIRNHNVSMCFASCMMIKLDNPIFSGQLPFFSDKNPDSRSITPYGRTLQV